MTNFEVTPKHVVRVHRDKGDFWYAHCPVPGCQWRWGPTDYRSCKVKSVEHAIRMTPQRKTR